MKKLFSFILFSAVVFGQSSLTTTSLSQAIGLADTTISTASTSGMIPQGQSAAPGNPVQTQLFVENEQMSLSSINADGTIKVLRHQGGTAASAHGIGALVWYGPPQYFYYGKDPNGTCIAANQPALPYLNVSTGNVFDCISNGIANPTSFWVNYIPKTFYGNPGFSRYFESPGPASWSPSVNGNTSHKMWAGWLLNVNGFPDLSRNLIVNVASPLITQIYTPAGVTAVAHGMESYALAGTAGTVSMGGYFVGLAGAANQIVYGANPNANDYPADQCLTGFCATTYASAFVNATEGDTGVQNPGTARRHNFLAEFRPWSTAQAGTIDASFYQGKDGAVTGALNFVGSGTNAMTLPASANYTGNITTTYVIQTASATTFNWCFYCSASLTVANGKAVTGNDGTGDGVSTFSAPSHYFTAGDVGGTVRVQILGGTGANAGTYTVSSVSSGVATLSGNPGTCTATCLYVIWQNTSVAASAVANELVMPQDTTVGYISRQNPLQYNQAVRGVASSYGMSIVWSPASGLTTGDFYYFTVNGVPPSHFAFATAPGGADVGLDLAAIQGGTSQFSQPIKLHATGSLGTDRVATIQNSPSGSGSVLLIDVPNTASSGVSFTAAGTSVAKVNSSGNITGVPLDVQLAKSPVTLTGGADVLFTYALPANTLTLNGCISVVTQFQHTTGSATTVYALTFGGVTSALATSTNVTPSNSTWRICNNGSLTANQQITNSQTNVGAITPAAVVTGSVDTTAAVNITLTATGTAGTQAVTPEYFEVVPIK